MYRSVWAVHTGPPADQYTDRPLPGSTADWGCFRLVTTRNRPVTVDFGRCQPREGERIRGRRRRGRRKTCSPVLLFAHTICRPRAISSPRAGRRNVSPHGEKERGDVITHLRFNNIIFYYCTHPLTLLANLISGMSDLCSPVIILLEDEADAFWCFERLMRKLRGNFRCTERSVGVENQLQSLASITQVLDPKLHQHLGI
ncbi:hypothetical protein B296_00012233 [Ensete ventricosum]|uniref:Rab-GAP TBC domain-containing protein n=1 Tax=Ensete ventricosum TaxID=4639 RepID=A0A427AW63_ENSVE|nr:hypothetical protein B296_00012233 [Ensete ventricosum]